MSGWIKGYPKERGLFRVRIDGEKETYAVHHHCELNGRSWWTDTSGRDVVGYQIEWTGRRITPDDLRNTV